MVQNPTVSFDADDRANCPPLQTLLYSTSPDIRAGSILEWNVEGMGTIMNTDTVVINFEEQTTYDVSLKITTPEGCVSSKAEPDYLEVYRVPIPRFVFNPSVPNTIENLVLFQNQSLYANSSEWYIDGEYLNNQRSPYHQFDSINGAFYEITLRVQSAGGCEDSLTKRLQVEDAFDVYIPNSFTPDGDGRNETFGPVSFGIDTKGYSFAIYNRWGEQLFFSEVVGETWDGKYHGEFVPAGVYVYQVIVRAGTNATEKRYYGPVTVLR